MLAYIVRRILLMIPTIFGILLISFVIVQFAPGGPVERILAQLQGLETSATANFTGGADTRAGEAVAGRVWLALSRRAGARPEIHRRTQQAIRLRQAGARALLDRC